MARKYLSKSLGGGRPVRFCCISRRIRKSWQTHSGVWLVAVPWLCIFIACGTGTTSSPSATPASGSPRVDSSAPTSAAPTRKSEFALETEARALAWRVVEKHLTFPHDADFSWLTECKRLNDHSFAAFGTVKAANALGAKLTYDWRVVLALNEQDQFLPMYIQIGDEESALASDDSLAVFLGKPTSATVAAAETAENAKAIRQASFRTMSDDTGDFTVTARVVSFRNHQKHGGMVTLEKENGSTIEVPTSRLSKQDAEWVREEIKRRAK